MDLLAMTELPIPTLYEIIDKSLADIDEALDIIFHYHDLTSLKEASDGFSRYGRSPLRCCVGSLYSLAIKIIDPSKNQVTNPSAYYNRKFFFDLKLHGLCDHKLKFLFVSVVTLGSSQDYVALQLSALFDLPKRK